MTAGRAATAVAILARLKDAIGRELHDYPYPIAGCDEAFKTLVYQKECCRIALAGLQGHDGLYECDAIQALRDLLATPAALGLDDRQALELITRELA